MSVIEVFALSPRDAAAFLSIPPDPGPQDRSAKIMRRLNSAGALT
jgi:hypothetical protein